jgi:cytoskeletal protein RodZ
MKQILTVLLFLIPFIGFTQSNAEKLKQIQKIAESMTDTGKSTIDKVGAIVDKLTDTGSKTPTLDKVEQLVDKYSVKVANVFVATMEKATPVAKEGFQAAVWFQVAKGVAEIIPLVFFLVFLFLLINEYNSIYKVLNSDAVPAHMSRGRGPLHESNISLKLILYLLLFIASTITTAVFVWDGIMHLVAPKWFAIKDIIELVK